MKRIIVIGIGGSGLHVLGLIQPRASPAPLLVGIDTDDAALLASAAQVRITVSLASADMDTAIANARVRIETLFLPHVAGADTVILTAGLGGEAASLLLPMVARLVREHGMSAFILATTPAATEDAVRHERARRSLEAATGVTVLLGTFPADGKTTGGEPGQPASSAALGPIVTRLADALQRPITPQDVTRIANALRRIVGADEGVTRSAARAPVVIARPYRMAASVESAGEPGGPRLKSPAPGGSSPDESDSSQPANPSRGSRGASRGAATFRREKPPARVNLEIEPQPAAPTRGVRGATPGAGRTTGGGNTDRGATRAVGSGTGRGSGEGKDLSADLPDAITDHVHFTITTPASVAPGSFFVLGVWAHLGDSRDQVIERAREEYGDDIQARSKGPVRVARGAMLTVRLSIPGAEVDDPEDVILWEGDTGNADFPVHIPEATKIGRMPGSVAVHLDGLRIARIHFTLEVGAPATGIAAGELNVVRYRTAFASYSSKDRDLVLGRIQGMHQIAPDLDIFLDVVTLRSGQRWAEELYKRIPTSDVFYLFWSPNARTSQWVEKEWRCALETKGIEFIDPVPLVSPDLAPPPAELGAIHFNDWHLAFMSRPRPAAVEAKPAGESGD